MTEEEWLAAETPYPMFDFLGRTVSPRKLRLFGIACCRRLRSLMVTEECREAVILAERLVEGEAAPGEVAWLREQLKARYLALCESRGSGRKAYVRLWCIGAAKNLLQDEESYLRGADIWAGDADLLRAWQSASSAIAEKQLGEEFEAQVNLLREILGNPFRPVAFSPDWRTETAVALARQMYESRDFGAMPILADALQDAGCDNDDILNHCRDPKQVHVRGCWVVDLVLGKE